jgi:hypothetical protein
METSKLADSFYLYLWRSPQLPGTLYLARGFDTTEALCRELTQDGYIVKVIHTATDTEYEWSDGSLHPSAQGPSTQGMSPAFV